MRIPLLLFLFAATLSAARAQSPNIPVTGPARGATVFDLTGAVGKEPLGAEPTVRAYLSGAGWRLWRLDDDGRFQAGVGARISHYRSQGATYELTGRSPTPYMPLYVPGQLYVPRFLHIMKPRLVALNAALHLRARVVGRFRVGFTIDLVGLTLGSGKSYGHGQLIGTLRPTRVNLLLGGEKDRGSLNSEFYVSADLTPHLSVRAGLSHVVNAYEIKSASKSSIQYRIFGNLGLLGVSYTF